MTCPDGFVFERGIGTILVYGFNIGCHFFMIQDVAKIDGINTFIGKLKMNDNYSV